MRTFRIILLIILGLMDIYFAYATIGYIFQSFDYPLLVGESTSIFFGVYIMAIIFFLAFIITTIIYILVLRKLLKIKEK